MSDNHLPPNSLHGASLPDAHKQPKISEADAHKAVEIAALQKHLRDLRAEAASLTGTESGTAAKQLALATEINSAIQVLHKLGATEQPQ